MTANLAAALVAAQADMPAVEPDAVNPHFKTKFVSLDNLIARTRPVLNQHGLALIQLPAVSETGHPVLRTILLHGESGEQVTADAPLMLGKNDMQGLGSAITYARRYAWAAALGISSDEDDDGNTASPASPEPVAEPAPSFQAPSGAKTITQAQRTRLHTIATRLRVPTEDVKRIIKETAGVESSTDIPTSKYDAVVAAVERAGEDVPF